MYDINFIIIAKNETINLAVSDENMSLFEKKFFGCLFVSKI